MELIEKICQCWFAVCVSSFSFRINYFSTINIVLLPEQKNISFISLKAKKNALILFCFILFCFF